jgi:hypothetical protein
MLFHDTVTGQLHEVPDHALAEDAQGASGYGEGQVMYDGLGNPLGLWFLPKVAALAAKAIAPLAAKAIPAAAKFLPKIAGKFLPKVTRFLPNVTRFLPRVPQLVQRGLNLVQRLPFQPQLPMPMPAMPDPSAMMPGPEPEQELGEMVYDGLGNPVGFVPSFSFRPPGVSFQPPGFSFRPPQFSFRPPGVSITPPGVRVGQPRPIMGGFHILQRLRTALAQARAQGQAPHPALVARYQQMLNWYRRMRAMRGGIPPGWMRRPVPYTGLGPNRLYMRCATWPGPAGLVPASAATAAAATAAAAAAAPSAGGRRRRRRRR